MSIFFPPDWRDASAYPAKVDDLSPSRWAWEFLRRNPEYQKDYEHFASLPSYRPNGSKTVKWYSTQAQWWDDPKLRYCKYPLIPDDEEDNIGEYFNRTGDDTPFHYSLEDHLIEKWGLTGTEIFEPSYDEGDQSLYFDSSITRETQGSVTDQTDTGLFDVTLKFDLRFSIEKQLKETKEILLHYKEGLENHVFFPELKNEIVKDIKSIQIKKLPIYLRSYDGYHAGATLLEIGKVIFNGIDEEADKQSASRASKKGRSLVYGGYRELIKM